MKRILIVLHGEEPKGKSTSGIKPRIGLSVQGAVRAYLLPEMIKRVFGDEPYEVHTYDNKKSGKPVSRSYFTVKSLAKRATIVTQAKSDDVDGVVKAIKASKASNILVSWKGTRIPSIIKKLLNNVTKPDYDIEEPRFAKLLDPSKATLRTVSEAEVEHIELCSSQYRKANESAKHAVSKTKKEVKHSIVWDLTYDPQNPSNNSYRTFANYVIYRDETSAADGRNWIVEDYLDHFLGSN
jgi:hypothetical protein